MALRFSEFYFSFRPFSASFRQAKVSNFITNNASFCEHGNASVLKSCQATVTRHFASLTGVETPRASFLFGLSVPSSKAKTKPLGYFNSVLLNNPATVFQNIHARYLTTSALRLALSRSHPQGSREEEGNSDTLNKELVENSAWVSRCSAVKGNHSFPYDLPNDSSFVKIVTTV